MRLAQYKLPIKTKFIGLEEGQKPTQVGKAPPKSSANSLDEAESAPQAETASVTTSGS